MRARAFVTAHGREYFTDSTGKPYSFDVQLEKAARAILEGSPDLGEAYKDVAEPKAA
jgi:hypothetical protein